MNTTNTITKRIILTFFFALAVMLTVCVCRPAVLAAADDGQPATPTLADCPHKDGATRQENYVAPTCVKEGSYDNVTRCAICGEILRTEHVRVEKTDRHVPAPITVENVKTPTCAEEGSYDEITRCQICGKLLDTNHVRVRGGLPHTPAGAVMENKVPSTCKNQGSYDSVVYCQVCGKELSRTHKQLEAGMHIADYQLKRTVRSDSTGRTAVTFEDPAYPVLIKDVELHPSYEGRTVEAGKYLAGDGSKRTCADGETRCALCGELLEEAIPHQWDRSQLGTPGKVNTSGTATLSCLLCGETYSISGGSQRFGKIGDLNGDGVVSTAEARLVLRYSVGLGNLDKAITTVNFSSADADRNGEIEPTDARLILRIAVGLRLE